MVGTGSPALVAPEHSLARINRIANGPAVRPFIDCGQDLSVPLDFAPAMGPVEQTGTIFLSNGDDGVAAFGLSDLREWQCIIMFGERCRGRRALDLVAAMLDWMRPHADVIWGAIPIGNRKARWFARASGFCVISGNVTDNNVPVEIVAHGNCQPTFGFLIPAGSIH